MIRHFASIILAFSAFAGFSATQVDAQQVATYTTPVGLAGYSPVSYLESSRAEPGSPAISADHEGVTYFFTSEAQRRTFLADPDRFLPAYGGHCAFGCSVGSTFTPDPTSFSVIDGKTHLFLKNAEVDAKTLWEQADPAEVRERADRYWAQRGDSRAYLGARNVDASGVALQGYSPVSYFTLGRPEMGDPRFAAEHNGITYWLASDEQLRLFKQNAGRYEPQCGGWCAFGMSVEDKFPIDPTSYKIIEDKLYVFLKNSSTDARGLWNRGDEAKLLRKAHAHWKKVSG